MPKTLTMISNSPLTCRVGVWCIAGFAVYAGLGFPAANAQEAFTGKEMLGYCSELEKDLQKDFERGICVGFLDGFVSGHRVAETYHAFHHREENIDNVFGRLCLGPKVNRAQLAKTFNRYMGRFPQKLTDPAGLLLEEALREAYPCPAK
ncbi:MAG: Rap1a/Tai family immunity protein [Burkholderiales bacterium]